jgi:thymidine kinase
MNTDLIDNWKTFLDEIKTNDTIYQINLHSINKLIDTILINSEYSFNEKISLAQLLDLDNKTKIYFTLANSYNIPQLIKGEACFHLANLYNDSLNEKAKLFYDMSYDLGYVDGAKYNGSIHLIFGPMFSGKTTELLRQLTRKKIAGQDNILIKYSGDNRFDDTNIVTHDKIMFESTRVSKGHCLRETVGDLLEQQVIGTNVFIDEIQFFNDGAEICDSLANNGYNVFACGLQGDYNRKIFPTIAKLIPLCDKITHLTSIDKKSGKECTNTKRICDSNELELIGGNDLYQAVDRYNYYNNL